MANVTVINNTQPAQQSTTQGSSLLGIISRLLSILIPIVLIGILFIVFGLTYIIIDNWDYIATFFTTGFIGWLNPFDSNEDDKGPIESWLDNETGLTGTSAIVSRVVATPFRWLFR